MTVRGTKRPSRLSPVDEVRPQTEEPVSSTPARQGDTLNTRTTPQRTYKSDGSYFELVVPPSQSRRNSGDGDTYVPESAATAVASLMAIPRTFEEKSSELTFTRIKVPPVPTRSTPSALSLILASKASKTDNPFSELYTLISSRSNPLSLEITYPFSNPRKTVTIKVRADATVEEVIGFALWTYWEEGYTPKLDEVEEGRRRDRLSAAGWSLRITEDGDVDDDFPGACSLVGRVFWLIELCAAMVRTERMSKFNFEGYAIVPESAAQSTSYLPFLRITPSDVMRSAEQNRIAEAKIIRRPSRVMLAKKKVEPPASLAPPSTNATGGIASSMVSQAPMLSSSIGGGSSISHGPQQFLRVKMVEKAEDVHYSTTIPVYVVISYLVIIPRADVSPRHEARRACTWKKSSKTSAVVARLKIQNNGVLSMRWIFLCLWIGQ